MSCNTTGLVPEKVLSVLERNTGGPESPPESMFQVMRPHSSLGLGFSARKALDEHATREGSGYVMDALIGSAM
jgi:hypothetical protein